MTGSPVSGTTARLRDLPLGTRFACDGGVYRVSLRTDYAVEATGEQFSNVRVFRSIAYDGERSYFTQVEVIA